MEGGQGVGTRANDDYDYTTRDTRKRTVFRSTRIPRKAKAFGPCENRTFIRGKIVFVPRPCMIGRDGLREIYHRDSPVELR